MNDVYCEQVNVFVELKCICDYKQVSWVLNKAGEGGEGEVLISGRVGT